MRGRPNAGVHADKGGVAAGRDIVAQLLITGDHNVVFAGGYQQLEDAFVDPSSVFERVHTERFTGREWLIDETYQFLAERERGYLVVEARAGLGKTALLADLARTRAWICHFVELAPGQGGIDTARRNLASQIIRAYELGEAYARDLLPEQAANRPDLPEDGA